MNNTPKGMLGTSNYVRFTVVYGLWSIFRNFLQIKLIQKGKKRFLAKYPTKNGCHKKWCFTWIPSSLSVLLFTSITSVSGFDFGAKFLEHRFAFMGTSWDGRIALKQISNCWLEWQGWRLRFYMFWVQTLTEARTREKYFLLFSGGYFGFFEINL